MSARWTGVVIFAVSGWLVTSQAMLATSHSKVPAKVPPLTKATETPERFLTSLSTDKPIYQAGEKVYVRGVLLSAADHKPLPAKINVDAVIEIKGPKGDVVARGNAASQDSSWGFAWQVPQGQAGGNYVVHAFYPVARYAFAERKFDIREYRAPRLKSQITFLRDGYGPGDKVTATLEVKRAEGGIPEGAKVTATAVVDGANIADCTSAVDAQGHCSVSFDLPKEIEAGEGTLALAIEDGGVVETASKSIPILLSKVDLDIYPEGGDLLAGYKNRVYIQATQPNGKPADLSGTLMREEKNESAEAVMDFRTEHEGRGRFEFTPDLNRKYYLSISQPSGIKEKYYLPLAKPAGAVIHSDKDTFAKGESVTVDVGCTSKVCKVTLAKRAKELQHFRLQQSSRKLRTHSLEPVAFDLPADTDGVLTVTVWDAAGMPLAERLIFREPAKPLKLTVTADKQSYVPGDEATLTVKATDASGDPVSALVGLTVTDDSVLEMVEKREQAPQLPVMVFLEPEVKDLADAQVYLDPQNQKAALATDLLRGIL